MSVLTGLKVDIQPTACVFAATPPSARPPSPSAQRSRSVRDLAGASEALAVAPQGALALARALYLLSFYTTTA